MSRFLHKIKIFMNIDLIIFGIYCGLTFFLCGGYMTRAKRKSRKGMLEIFFVNLFFWGLCSTIVYKILG